MVESRLATRNMASSEEGSTHTRTIQKRAKKTQDQACQFDASLLEGERSCEIFLAFTHSLLLGWNTMALWCDECYTKVKYFSAFHFFRRKGDLWGLQPNFRVRDVKIDIISFVNESGKLSASYWAFKYVLCPRDAIDAGEFVGARTKRLSSGLKSLSIFFLRAVFSLDFLLNQFSELTAYCDISDFFREFSLRYERPRFIAEVCGYFSNRKRRILEIPREFGLVYGHPNLSIAIYPDFQVWI